MKDWTGVAGCKLREGGRVHRECWEVCWGAGFTGCQC